MAVSQISMTDADITGASVSNIGQMPEKKDAPNKNYEQKKSMGMDDLMSNLTSTNKPPAGKISFKFYLINNKNFLIPYLIIFIF
jgi:hypothetical protein